MSDAVVQDTISAHRRRERRRWLIIGAFALFGLVTLVLDIATGPAMYSPSELVKGLFQFRDAPPSGDSGWLVQRWWAVQQWLGIEGVDGTVRQIVHDLRLPMALMARDPPFSQISFCSAISLKQELHLVILPAV